MKICLISCFLLNDELISFMNHLRKDLLKLNYELILISHIQPKNLSVPIIILPYSFPEFYNRNSSEDLIPSVETKPIGDLLTRTDQLFCSESHHQTKEMINGFHICARTLETIVACLKPSIGLVWGISHPQSQLLKFILEKNSIPSFILERGLFPETLMLESYGYGTESDLNRDLSFWHEWCNKKQRGTYQRIKSYYLDKKPQKYFQNSTLSPDDIRESLQIKGNKIGVFWGQHDIWSGIIPREAPQAHTISPFFTSCRDALISLKGAVHNHPNITILFKPHPHDNQNYLELQDQSIKVINNIDNHTLFNLADIFIAMTTTTQFESLFYEKPLILLANSQLNGKNIAYEYDGNISLESLIKDALKKTDFETKLENSKLFISGLFEHFLYGTNYSVPSHNRITEFSRFIIETAKNEEDSYESNNSNKISSNSFGSFMPDIIYPIGDKISQSIMFTEEKEADISNHMSKKTAVRSIAFYLPQYHPIPENDKWWGKGFTEWTNVTKARPLFPGHYQPHLPADLGFYDLRLAEVREAQAEMAKEYGISGFCYYHYWFKGKQLLHRVFDEVLASGKPDFPFCLCWANENWTRVWDGGDKKILMRQGYSERDDKEHIAWLIKAFSDPRYIKVQGKPLLLVYRASDLLDPAKMASLWREEVKNAGFPDLYLCKVESFESEHTDPQITGFDASVEFQPDWSNLGPKSEQYQDLNVFEYDEIVDRMLDKPYPEYKRFPCVTPSWDNTPRRGQDGYIFHNSRPSYYEKWLRHAVSRVHNNSSEEQIVFINAWNEWGEGNHLEPDQQHGHAFLHATRRALMIGHEQMHLNEELTKRAGRALDEGQMDEAERLLHEALSHDPDAPATLHQYGILQHLRGKTQQAIDIMENASKIDPGNSEILNDIGALYYQTGVNEKALLYFEKAAKACPEDMTVHKNLADLYIEINEPEKARKVCRKILSMRPEDTETSQKLHSLEKNLEAHAIQNSCRESTSVSPRGGIDPSMKNYTPISTSQTIPTDWTTLFDYQRLVDEEIDEYCNIPVTDNLREGGIHANLAWEYWFGYLVDRVWKTSLGAEIIGLCKQIDHPRILSLGCGYGGIELDIARSLEKPYKIDGVDINENILRDAINKANKENLDITFVSFDLNFIEIEESSYDIIYAHASLHHLLNLEHIMYQIHKGLKPGGKLVVLDLIGKTQVLFWKDNVDFARKIVQEMPKRYTAKIRNLDEIIPPFTEPTIQQGMEGIRQEEIEDIIMEFFKPVEVYKYGSFMRMICTNPVLGKLFDPSRKKDRAFLEKLFKFDLKQIEDNTLRPTEIFGIFEKKQEINAEDIFKRAAAKMERFMEKLSVKKPINASSHKNALSEQNRAQSTQKHDKHPRTSIILPTGNSLQGLHNTLNAILSTIRNHEFEVLIINEGASQEITEYVAGLNNKYIKPLEHDPHKSTIAGCISAVEHASGEYLALIHPLIIVTKGWLDSLHQITRNRPDCGAVVAKTTDLNKKILEAGCTYVHEHETHSRGYGMPLRSTRFEHIAHVYAGSRYFMFIKKTIYDASAGLDPHLSDFGTGLIDLGMDLVSRGIPVFYQPKTILVLQDRTDNGMSTGKIIYPDQQKLSSIRPVPSFSFDGNLHGKAPSFKILVLGIYLANKPNTIEDIVSIFGRPSKNTVVQRWVALNGEPPSKEVSGVTIKRLSGMKPKFEIINDLIKTEDLSQYDYVLLCDDDIVLPEQFVSDFFHVQHSLGFSIAQPARTINSYIDHPIVEQHTGVHARQTGFVEIGPVVSFHKSAFDFIFPFDLTSPMGWGYENVWAYEINRRDLKMGIIDCLCVDHSLRKPVAHYNWSQADNDRTTYLAKHEHVPLEECFSVVNTHIIGEVS